MSSSHSTTKTPLYPPRSIVPVLVNSILLVASLFLPIKSLFIRQVSLKLKFSQRLIFAVHTFLQTVTRNFAYEAHRPLSTYFWECCKFHKIHFRGLLLPWCGFSIGCFTAILLRQPPPNVTAIAIETGIQNTGIAIMLLKVSMFPYRFSWKS